MASVSINGIEYDTAKRTRFCCRDEPLDAAEAAKMEKTILKWKTLYGSDLIINPYGTLMQFPPARLSSVCRLPDCIKAFVPGVFANNPYLREITLPKELRLIPSDCFSGCENLEKLHGLESVEFVDRGAFFGCKKLETLVFSDRLWGMNYPFDDSPSAKKLRKENAKP